MKRLKKKLVEKAVKIVCSRFKIINPQVRIKITSSLPTGRHLGSSAAVSVAVVGALLYFFKKIWNPNLINELAYEVEKFQHGNPSGGDNSVVTFGGFIWYRKELEFLKSIWQLPFKPSPKLPPFVLLDTGRPKENTGEMVESVAGFIKKYSEKAGKLLDMNEQATKEVTQALKEGNEERLIKAIRKGEKTLEGLGVVSKKAVSLIREIEKNGGAAKILGGGGKKGPVGFILAYHQDKAELKQIADNFGYPLVKIKLAEEGVRLEKNH